MKKVSTQTKTAPSSSRTPYSRLCLLDVLDPKRTAQADLARIFDNIVERASREMK